MTVNLTLSYETHSCLLETNNVVCSFIKILMMATLYVCESRSTTGCFDQPKYQNSIYTIQYIDKATAICTKFISTTVPNYNQTTMNTPI